MTAEVTAMGGPQRNRQPSRQARRGGNVASIVINAVLLYLINAHPGWQSASFLTPAAAQVIGLVNLTLVAGIVANAVYFVADPKWLRAAGDLATLTITLVTTVRIWEVFPFAFHGSLAYWSTVVRVLLIVGVVGVSIGILYSLSVLIKGMVKVAR